MFKTVYRPILTYSCKFWVLSKQDNNKVQALEMKYLQRAKSVAQRNRIKINQIRQQLEIEPITNFIELRQLAWWEHLQWVRASVSIREIGEAR